MPVSDERHSAMAGRPGGGSCLRLRVFLAVALLISPATATGQQDLPPVGVARPCVSCSLELADLESLYSDRERAALRAGDVLISEEGRETAGEVELRTRSAEAVLMHSPDRIWSVLTDFESWPGFMPHIKRTEITRRDDRKMWVRQSFRIALVSMRHTTIYSLDPRQGELHWRLDPDSPADMAASQGRWQLMPIDDGSHTLLRYQAAMDPGRRVPGFVEKMVVHRSLRDLIGNLSEEVRRREEQRTSGQRDRVDTP
jgi:ribosome-associated toxin RatA of RatAB toxin-antitoxin module